MNPLALGLVAIGALLFGLGLFLAVKHRKRIGIAVSLLGVVTAAAPIIITWFLF
jgi:hypothetical protein